jgi:hypothetical protein
MAFSFGVPQPSFGYWFADIGGIKPTVCESFFAG